MSSKFSRRRIVSTVVDLLEKNHDSKYTAKLLVSYLKTHHLLRDIDLYLRDIKFELWNRYNLVSADVVSARKLSDNLNKSIVAFIKSVTRARQVEITNIIDPDIIGGIIINTPDVKFDASVRTRLKKLNSI